MTVRNSVLCVDLLMSNFFFAPLLLCDLACVCLQYYVTWATQFLLVSCLYFERPYTLAEYKEARGSFQAVQQVGEGEGERVGAERHSTMTFSLTGGKGKESLIAMSSSFSGLEAENDSMRTVPWTTTKNPEAEASFFSRMTFSWMNPLFKFAHKHELEQEDIFDIRTLFRSHRNSQTFEAIWDNEKKHFKGDAPSLTRALVKAYFWVIFPAAPLLMLQNVAQLVLPFLLGPLIEFMVGLRLENVMFEKGLLGLYGFM